MRELQEIVQARINELASQAPELNDSGLAHLKQLADFDFDEVDSYEVTENSTHKLVEVKMKDGTSNWLGVHK